MFICLIKFFLNSIYLFIIFLLLLLFFLLLLLLFFFFLTTHLTQPRGKLMHY